jgi:hypothetical protein
MIINPFNVTLGINIGMICLKATKANTQESPKNVVALRDGI